MLHISGDILIVIWVIVIWHFGNVKSNICFVPLASFGGLTPKQYKENQSWFTYFIIKTLVASPAYQEINKSLHFVAHKRRPSNTCSKVEAFLSAVAVKPAARLQTRLLYGSPQRIPAWQSEHTSDSVLWPSRWEVVASLLFLGAAAESVSSALRLRFAWFVAIMNPANIKFNTENRFSPTVCLPPAQLLEQLTWVLGRWISKDGDWGGNCGSGDTTLIHWSGDQWISCHQYPKITPEGIRGHMGVWRVSGWHLQRQLMLPVCEHWKCDKGLNVADRSPIHSENRRNANKDMRERIFSTLFCTHIFIELVSMERVSKRGNSSPHW